MLLSELLRALDYNEIVNRSGIDPAHTDVTSLSCDSRKVVSGSIFVCLSGSQTDGHDYAWGAYNRMCRIFVTEHATDLPDDAFVIIASNTRVALAELSATFFGHPADEMTIIGVTGTKGKTTSSLLIYDILNKNGIPTGYIGSNGVFYLDTHCHTVNTTPESYDLHMYMRKMVDAGIRTLVMEVSSQALKMARVHGIRYHVCAFTNLAPDHIGEYEHPDFDDYKSCKRSLFTDYGAEYIVYNADDEYASEMIGGNRCEKAGTAIYGAGDFCASDITYFRSPGNVGVSFDCTHKGTVFPVCLSFPGEFSVYNALTAIAVCSHMGLELPTIAATIRDTRIKGRFETYELPSGATVVIDYAHNGVSLKAALQALRAYEPTRLICLFGAIGGRTRMRRAELGLVASRDADYCILTSDNPDRESPAAIISEVASYFTTGACPYVAIADRRRAIEHALTYAKKGDIILLAGKGHETYQIIQGVRESFSEAEIVQEFVSANTTTLS